MKKNRIKIIAILITLIFISCMDSVMIELENGKDGTVGIDGIDGINGQDGNDGTDGTNGVDGIGLVMTQEEVIDAQGNVIGHTMIYWRDLNYNGEYDSGDEFHLSVFSEHPKDGIDGIDGSSSIITAEFIDDENCTGGARLVITTEVTGKEPVIISNCLQAGEPEQIGLILPFTFEGYDQLEENGFYSGDDGHGRSIFQQSQGVWNNSRDFENATLEMPRIMDEKELLNFSGQYTANRDYVINFYGILPDGSNTVKPIGILEVAADSKVSKNGEKNWKSWVVPESTEEAIVGIRIYIHLEEGQDQMGWIAFDNIIIIYKK